MTDYSEIVDGDLRDTLGEILTASSLLAPTADHRAQLHMATEIWQELEARRARQVIGDPVTIGPIRSVAGDVDHSWLGQWVAVTPQDGTIVEFVLDQYRVDRGGTITLCRDAEIGFALDPGSPVNVSPEPCFGADAIRSMFESDIPGL